MQQSQIQEERKNKKISPKFVLMVIGVIICVLGAVAALTSSRWTKKSPGSFWYLWLLVAVGALVVRVGCYGSREASFQFPALYKEPDVNQTQTVPYTQGQVLVPSVHAQAHAAQLSEPKTFQQQNLYEINFHIQHPHSISVVPQMSLSTGGGSTALPGTDNPGHVGGPVPAGELHQLHHWNSGLGAAQTWVHGEVGSAWNIGSSGEPGNMSDGAIARDGDGEPPPPTYWEAVAS